MTGWKWKTASPASSTYNYQPNSAEEGRGAGRWGGVGGAQWVAGKHPHSRVVARNVTMEDFLAINGVSQPSITGERCGAAMR